MLEKPALPDATIIDALRRDYGLDVAQIEFLPLGADMNTAVYRAAAGDGTLYFVKLRRGHFDETTVIVPRLVHDQGVRQVIPPLPTQSGRLWAALDGYRLILSAFVAGRNGYQMRLSDGHWIDLGRALRGIHTAAVPADVLERLPRENYSAHWREAVRMFQRRVESEAFTEHYAAGLADLLNRNRDTVTRLVSYAERLAAVLESQSPPFVVCHGDIHAGNVLIDDSDVLHVVDWDTLILAPRERDLMYPGGGLFGGWRAPEDEETWFYRGYGEAAVDPVALAYYRCERVVQDIAAYCEQLLLTDEGGEDRAEGLRQISGQFQPGEVIDLALRVVARLPPEYGTP